MNTQIRKAKEIVDVGERTGCDITFSFFFGNGKYDTLRRFRPRLTVHQCVKDDVCVNQQFHNAQAAPL